MPLAPSTQYMYRSTLRKLLAAMQDEQDEQTRAALETEAASLLERLKKSGVSVTREWLYGRGSQGRPPVAKAPTNPESLREVRELAQPQEDSTEAESDRLLQKLEEKATEKDRFWSEEERAKRARAIAGATPDTGKSKEA